MKKTLLAVLKTAFLFTLLCMKPVLCFAVDFEVNTTKDELDFNKCTPATPKNCSLRTAIVWSNQLVGLDTIKLPANVYPITRLGKEPFPINPEVLNDFDIRDSVVIKGAGVHKTIIDGMGTSRIFEIHDIDGVTQTVSLEDLSLRHGALDQKNGISAGAAIRAFGFGVDKPHDRDSLTLRRVRIYDNIIKGDNMSSAALDFSGEILRIEDSEIDHNQHEVYSDVPLTFSVISIAESSSVVVEGSRIHDNQGPAGSCMLSVGNVQKLWWDKTELSDNDNATQVCINAYSGTMVFSNSTFSGNSGAVISNGSNVGLLHVTLVNNNLKNLRNQVLLSPLQTTLWLKNTIIANPKSKVNCEADNDDTIVSLGNNIASDDSCLLDQASDHPTTDPLLEALQFNGGTTKTHMPLLNSPAIDGGEILADVLVDQRGMKRPFGKSADIGAVERGAIVSLAP